MVDRCAVWYPTVFPDRCDSCRTLESVRCVQFCPKGVFEVRKGGIVVAKPYKCVYGCTACEPVCPKKAINFPKRKGLPTVKSRDKGLIRKIVCLKCGKQLWTNRESKLCMSCE